MEVTKLCKKTPLQLELLEQFYAEERYPSQAEMEEYAASLKLTYKQVRGWFVERRRKEKEGGGGNEPSLTFYAEKFREICRLKESRKDKRLLDAAVHGRGKGCFSWSSGSVVTTAEKRFRIQDVLLSPDYIIKKILRKNGPALGVEFDPIPGSTSSENPASHFAGQEAQRAPKRRKVPEHQDCNRRNAPGQHGVGKGLITAWRLTNPNFGSYPTGICFTAADSALALSPNHLKSKKKWHKQKPKNKSQGIRKHDKKITVSLQRREVVPEQQVHTECSLAFEGTLSQEPHNLHAELIDDEELELRELQAGPKPVTCSAHFATSGLHRCSFCKDLLSKFPPAALKMKQPFSFQPWHSSPDLIKQFFKVLHFLYTYATLIDICPFTSDDFAQAFHDKDSLLLGEVHLALLKLLLSDIKTELIDGFPLQFSTSYKFLGLLQAVRHQESVVDVWSRCLNPLTWTEVLRQVFVAAGYGYKNGNKDSPRKELNQMDKHGLRPGTLKGELFGQLSQRGNKGMRVSELAKSLQIEGFHLTSTFVELEHLISSTLSSDITLFEKISPMAYRVRVKLAEDNFLPETEYSGSVHDCSNNTMTDSSSDSEDDSENTNSTLVHRLHHCNKQKSNMLAADTEIDESHPGEVWLLGLTEGEYSDLKIEEKLNALVALVDLLSNMSCFRSEKEREFGQDLFQSTKPYGSGAKIKRSTVRQNEIRPSWHNGEQMHTLHDRPIDSSSASKLLLINGSSSKKRDYTDSGSSLSLHPMQSVYLGSDRRYNRYWLFLGPCLDGDPGHRRIYFESSEDGHWEVIDDEEGFCSLMSVLDKRGTREAFLNASLEKREPWLLQAMSSKNEISYGFRDVERSDHTEPIMIPQDNSSPVSDVDNNLSMCDARASLVVSGAITFQLGNKEQFQKKKWDRMQTFDGWIWNSFYSRLNAVKHSRRSYLDSLARCEACHDLYWRDERHCKVCHTTFEVDFNLEEKYAVHACTAKEENCCFPKHKILWSQLQSLKAAAYAIEAAMPEHSLIGSWKKFAHKLWIKRLRRTSSLAELLQVLTDFVGAMNEDWFSECNLEICSTSTCKEVITSFPPFPQTSSAVALWLVKLDTLIAPFLERSSVDNPEINTQSKGNPSPPTLIL